MQPSTRQSLDRLLLRVVDGGLAGVIFLVPLLMGGRHAVGQLALTVLAVTAAWAWAARQCLRNDPAWRPTWAIPLLAAGIALTTLQAAPLSPSVLAWLAPRTAEILPLWTAGAAGPAALGAWPCVSFTPAESLAGLVLLLDFALLFFVAVQRIGHIEDVERLLRWCALSAACMAMFGIVQLLAGNGKFFWFYEHPFSPTFGAATGSFSNRNHFAHFLALGIGPLVWWLQDSSRRARARVGGANITVCPRTGKNAYRRNLHGEEMKTYLLGLTLGMVLFAGLLSLSRGGIVVMFLALAVCAAVSYRASALSGRFVAALGVIGLLTGVSLVIFGFDHVSQRIETLYSGSIERLDNSAGRRTIWAAAAKAIPDYLPLGTGVGSFRHVYPMYTDALPDEGLEYTHAESGYLQRALETGLTGGVLTLAGIILCAYWCVRGVRPSNATRLRLCGAAIAGSLAAVAAHALVDFVWYVPACMAIVAILAACALRIEQMGSGEWRVESGERRATGKHRLSLHPISSTLHSPLSTLHFSLAWPIALVVLTLLGGWMVASRVGPALAQPYWDEYQRARNAAEARSLAARDDMPAEIERQERWIACLENVVRWQPAHLPAHLALAESHRRLFDALQCGAENRMSLGDIRDAAIQSRFPSREALAAWLSRAVGKHWTHLERALYHTRQAIRLCPLQGRGYVYLADLSFLAGGDATVKRACVQQALCVRPFDGAVLYAAATEALLAGDPAGWLEYSKRAFRSGCRQQQQMIGDLAASTPSENLPALIDFMIREFQPNLEGLQFIHGVCAKRCPPEQLTALIRRRAEQAEIEAAAPGNCDAAGLWFEAQQMHSQLRNDAKALTCARNAIACEPGNYDAHYRLALCLLKEELFADAESHLRWCMQRRPSDQAVETNLRAAIKGRLDDQRRAAGSSQKIAR